MTLAITDVFAPAPSGVGPNPPPTGSWLASILQNAGVVGLSTTSWQSGGVGRTILAIDSNMLAVQDVNASIMSQGGFLDFAATGTVTFVDPFTSAAITRYVTPDPSNANTWPVAGGVPFFGWLDLLSDSVYNVQRIQATFANGSVTFTNTSGIASPTFQPGQFHIVNLATGATYTNSNVLTIASSGTTLGTFAADVAGSTGNATAGQVVASGQLVTSVVGVTITASTGFSGGTNFESNTALVTRCRLKVQALSSNGPKGAYAYWALTAFQFLQSFQSQVTTPLSKAITQAVPTLDTTTGKVVTAVSNGNGYAVGNGNPIVRGVANLAVTAATNATPIVLTVGSTTGLANGDIVQVSGVQGNSAANGFWPIAGVTGTTMQLAGSVGNGTYTTGGVVEGGDLGLVDFVIQGNAVPSAVTATTISAISQFVIVQATVYLPGAAATPTLAAQIDQALQAYFATVPIGGFVVGVPTANTMPFNEVVGVIQAVSAQIRDVTLTLNGVTVDVAINANSVPTVAYPGPTNSPQGGSPAGITFATF